MLSRYPGVSIRRAASHGHAGWLRRLPPALITRLDLGEAPTGSLVAALPTAAGARSAGSGGLRVEIGGGQSPAPGYVHVDRTRSSRHLEHVAPPWRLPFVDGSVQELRAVNVLQGLHPVRVGQTLREWRRVVCPGGLVRVEVPDARQLFRAFLDAPTDLKWLLLSPIFGYMSGSRPSGRRLEGRCAFDAELLGPMLQAAGFDSVERISDDDDARGAWEHLTSRRNLVMTASWGSATLVGGLAEDGEPMGGGGRPIEVLGPSTTGAT